MAENKLGICVACEKQFWMDPTRCINCKQEFRLSGGMFVKMSWFQVPDLKEPLPRSKLLAVTSALRKIGLNPIKCKFNSICFDILLKMYKTDIKPWVPKQERRPAIDYKNAPPLFGQVAVSQGYMNLLNTEEVAKIFMTDEVWMSIDCDGKTTDIYFTELVRFFYMRENSGKKVDIADYVSHYGWFGTPSDYHEGDIIRARRRALYAAAATTDEPDEQ